MNDRELLEAAGYDPEQWVVVDDSHKVTVWDDGKGGTNRSVKGLKVARKAGEAIDVSELVARIRKNRVPKESTREARKGSETFVVCLADWQIGKGDGDGVEGTTERLFAMIDSVKERYQALRRAGRPLGNLVVAGLGDMVEQCSGNYPSQQFRTQLNRREQMRLAALVVTEALKAWAPDFHDVTVTAVPGNHGENRNGDGKAFTTVGDNDDVAIFERVSEAFSMSLAFEHVHFFLPEDDMYMVLDVGPGIAFYHGHLGSKASPNDPAHKQMQWWGGQAFGRLGLEDVSILVTGHYHSFRVAEDYGRCWMQCPAMDGGSEWYTDQTGKHSRSGTLTFVLDKVRAKEIEVV